jgi:DNA-binding LytR/AlgR family response regulator
MYKVLIIEDEESAAERLKALLNTLEQGFEVLAILDSIQTALDYLAVNEEPNLVFMDIHLADGLSFEILERSKLSSPIIFITAYDEYAIQAFKVNSIDYLLKPLKKAELKQAISKFERFTGGRPKIEVKELISAIQNPTMIYQKRFMIKLGQSIKMVEADQIAYFYYNDRSTYLMDFSGNRLLTDFSMDELQNLLNPSMFFRINRQFILNIKSIQKMYTHSKSRVKVVLNPEIEIETIVSSERSSDFKTWLMGK